MKRISFFLLFFFICIQPMDVPLDKALERFCKINERAQKRFLAPYRFLKERTIEMRDSEGQTLLLRAVRYVNLGHEIPALLLAGADIHAKDNKNRTVFMRAAKNGYCKLVRFLAKCGADIHAKDFEGGTALHHACSNSDMVRTLLNLGMNVHERADGNITPLMAAARFGNEDAIALLIAHGARLEDTTTQMRNWPAETTPLFWSALGNKINATRLLIKAGANPNHQDEYGYSVLHYAAKQGNFEMLKLLIDLNVDLDLKTQNGYTALCIAALENHISCMRALIRGGANLSCRSEKNQDAIWITIDTQNEEACKLILAQYAREDGNFARSDSCVRALCRAAAINAANMIPILVASGIDINGELEGTYWTPLMFAARNGCIESIKILLQAGAKTIIRGNFYMWTIARDYEQEEALKLLKNYEKDIECLLDLLRSSSFFLAKELIKRNPLLLNASIHWCGTFFTPLMLAFKFCNFELCDFLLKQGANVNITNSRGINAASFARWDKPYEELLAIYQKKNTLYGAILLKFWNMDDEQLREYLGGYTRGQLEVLGVPGIILRRLNE